jgi:hypothetical protein
MKMGDSCGLSGDGVGVALRVVVAVVLGVEPRAADLRRSASSLSWALRAWLESRREAASTSRALAAASASSRSLVAAAAAEAPEPESPPEEGAAMVRGPAGHARRPEGARRPEKARAGRGWAAAEGSGSRGYD